MADNDNLISSVLNVQAKHCRASEDALDIAKLGELTTVERGPHAMFKICMKAKELPKSPKIARLMAGDTGLGLQAFSFCAEQVGDDLMVEIGLLTEAVELPPSEAMCLLGEEPPFATLQLRRGGIWQFDPGERYHLVAHYDEEGNIFFYFNLMKNVYDEWCEFMRRQKAS